MSFVTVCQKIGNYFGDRRVVQIHIQLDSIKQFSQCRHALCPEMEIGVQNNPFVRFPIDFIPMLAQDLFKKIFFIPKPPSFSFLKNISLYDDQRLKSTFFTSEISFADGNSASKAAMICFASGIGR